MAALCIVVVFIPEEDGTINWAGNVVMLLCAAFFGGFTYYGYTVLKSFPNSSISINEKGIWYSHLSELTNLIPWSQIHKIEEKPTAQKLVLKDENGAALINVHYQLEGFDELREKLTNYVKGNYSNVTDAKFFKSIGFHLFNVIAISCFIALAAYGFTHFSSFLFWSMVFLVLVCLYEYLSGFHRIYVSENDFVAKSMFRTMRYNFSEVLDIYMFDEHDKGTKIPKVNVVFQDEKNLRIPSMDRSAIEIYIILKNLASTK